jgi:hypothetical protein
MRTSGRVDSGHLFHKIYFHENVIFHKIRNKRMSGTRSTSRNTRMPGVIDTIFCKIFIQKHKIIRYVDIVDTLVYKVYIQKQENVR